MLLQPSAALMTLCKSFHLYTVGVVSDEACGLQKQLQLKGGASTWAAELEQGASSDAKLAENMWAWNKELFTRDFLLQFAEAQKATYSRTTDALARCIELLSSKG